MGRLHFLKDEATACDNIPPSYLWDSDAEKEFRDEKQEEDGEID